MSVRHGREKDKSQHGPECSTLFMKQWLQGESDISNTKVWKAVNADRVEKMFLVGYRDYSSPMNCLIGEVKSSRIYFLSP